MPNPSSHPLNSDVIPLRSRVCAKQIAKNASDPSAPTVIPTALSAWGKRDNRQNFNIVATPEAVFAKSDWVIHGCNRFLMLRRCKSRQC